MYKDLLDVKQIDTSRFESIRHRENFRQTIFGGQVLAQALMAATKTVENRLPHSLHAYFLRAGSSQYPIEYTVECLRDGRSISSRRVIAEQQGKSIFHLSASFHKSESGYEHANIKLSNVPQPEELEGFNAEATHAPEHAKEKSVNAPFQLLPIPEDIFTSPKQREANSLFWVRTIAAMPDNKPFHAASLAFTSDIGLLATTLLPHPTTLFSQDIFAASIDHAMWLHSYEFKSTDWLLFSVNSPWAAHARGFAQASIYTRDGKLIAHTSQEGLIRPL